MFSFFFTLLLELSMYVDLKQPFFTSVLLYYDLDQE